MGWTRCFYGGVSTERDFDGRHIPRPVSTIPRGSPKTFDHGEIKLIFAFAAWALVAGVELTRADDFGHIGINSSSAELRRPHDPLAPVSDVSAAPNASLCASDQTGAMLGCPTHH